MGNKTKVDSGSNTYTIWEKDNGQLEVTKDRSWGDYDRVAEVNTQKEAFDAIKSHSGKDEIKIR